MTEAKKEKAWKNLGARRIPKLRMADFPNADEIVQQGLLESERPETAVDILLVKPPTPDGGLWIRTQHRAGPRFHWPRWLRSYIPRTKCR